METPKPHPHADLINAWADGAKIQVKIYRKQEAPTWVDIENPTWSECDEYRIKPEAVAELIKAVLKDKLKISAPNTENFQLDGKPLTDGEKALIRALRSLEIYRVVEKPIVVYRDSEGNLLCGSEFVVFDTYATGDDQNEIIAALNQIQAE